MQDAAWNIFILIICDLDIDVFVFIIHATSSPSEIINKGVSLIVWGSINILEVVRSDSQLIRLPAEIEATPSNIVGIIISIFSLMLINGLQRLGPHITTMENRTE